VPTRVVSDHTDTANVMGQVVMFELARRFDRLRHVVYASSSSVYGTGDITRPDSVHNHAGKASRIREGWGFLIHIKATALSHL
jgi:UDP-glucuronate 4-epimerase